MSANYRIWFINFSYYSQSEFTELAPAIEHARACGVQSVVKRDGEAVASFCPLAGVRHYAEVSL